MKKICNKCKVPKELDEFYKHPDYKDGRCGQCKECQNKYSKKYQQENKENHTKNARKSRFKIKYNISLEEYDKLAISQNNKCAICGISREEHGKNLYVDHCHKTGKVRGLLCISCNHAIGMFKENIDTMLNAILYLNSPHTGL
jgi:hypothetical protein